MLPRLFRLVIHLAEGVFGVANGFTNDFQRFGHSLCVYVSMVGARVEDTVGLALKRPSMLDWHELLQAIQLYYHFGKKSIQNIFSNREGCIPAPAWLAPVFFSTSRTSVNRGCCPVALLRLVFDTAAVRFKIGSCRIAIRLGGD
jgi:hypothetical protein